LWGPSWNIFWFELARVVSRHKDLGRSHSVIRGHIAAHSLSSMAGGHVEKRNVGPNENYPLFQKHDAGCNVDSSSILHIRSLPLLRSRCKNTCLFKEGYSWIRGALQYSRKFLQVLICNENLVFLNKILHANQHILVFVWLLLALINVSLIVVERQLKESSKYQSIERNATRKYYPTQVKVKQKGTHSKMSKTWIMYQHEFHFRHKIQFAKPFFRDPKLFIKTASSISCCCSRPEWTCTHKNTMKDE
jgi:hypothetical protein